MTVMTELEDKIETLEKRIASQEARLHELEVRHRRDISALVGGDDLLHDYRKMLSAALADLCDRIIKLELLAYPNLVGDLDRLREIIGNHETKAFNSLDFRDSVKKSR
jgi:hypothetical protein